MQGIQAVQARIAAIRGLVESAAPSGANAGAFRAVLDDALGTSAAPVSKGSLTAPVDAPVSSRFGPRTHPITGHAQQHAGVDFAAPEGTPIRVAADGVVTFAGERGGYGNLVIVRHAGGIETYYAHQRELAVQKGQHIGAGEVIGTVGSTGRSTGPHLHLEVRRDGIAVDPLPWMGMAGIPRVG